MCMNNFLIIVKCSITLLSTVCTLFWFGSRLSWPSRAPVQLRLSPLSSGGVKWLCAEGFDAERKGPFSGRGALLFHLSHRCLLNGPVAWTGCSGFFHLHPRNVDFKLPSSQTSVGPREKKKPCWLPINYMLLCVCFWWGWRWWERWLCLSPSLAPPSLWRTVKLRKCRNHCRQAVRGNMMMKNASICAGVSVFWQRISTGKCDAGQRWFEGKCEISSCGE